MTPQEAKTLLEQYDYTVEAAGTPYRPGFFKVMSPNESVVVVSSEDLIKGATALEAEIAKARPKGWPSEAAWPPMKVERVGTTEDEWGKDAKGNAVLLKEGGLPLYKMVPDNAAINAAITEQRLAAQGGKERYPLPEGQPRTIEEGGQVYSWDSTIGDYKRVEGAGGPTPPPTDAQGNPQWTMQSGGQEFAWDSTSGSYKRVSEVAAGAGPTEQFLGTVEEGGWSIDQYGYTDASGKQVITARQPRAPIKDPQLSIKDMIANALKKVSDLNALDDPNLRYAQALYDFDTQIERRQLNHTIAMDRLNKALEIAQAPSDYLTLVALYTGALERDNPALVGERIAPLAQILQRQAQAFFLDIPGINTVPAYEPPPSPPLTAISPVTGKPYAPGETLATAREVATGGGVGGVGGMNTPPPGWGTNAYVPNDVWNAMTQEERNAWMDTHVLPDRFAGGVPSPAKPSLGSGYGEAGDPNAILPDETWEQWLARTGARDPFAAGRPATAAELEPGQPATEEEEMGIAQPTSLRKPPTVMQSVREQDEGFARQSPFTGDESFGKQSEFTGDEGIFRNAPFGERTLSIPRSEEQHIPSVPSPTEQGQREPSMLGSVGKFLQELGKEEDAKKKNRNIPEFQGGGIVPGYLGQPRLAQVEGGEAVLTPQQIQALLGQSGLFGPTYQVPPQQLPDFLRRPRTTSLSQLTGGALRPRSLQTIRQQSPTQRTLYTELAKSFGVPSEDFLEEERMATAIGGPRRMTRFAPGTIRTGA